MNNETRGLVNQTVRQNTIHMITCTTQDGLVGIYNKSEYSSSSIEFDTVNSLIITENKSQGRSTETSVIKFSQIEQIDVSGHEMNDDCGGYCYGIRLLDTKLKEIWSCAIEDDHERYVKVLSTIQNVLKLTLENKALKKYSVRCKACDRVISKVSEQCIYCGEQKINHE